MKTQKILVILALVLISIFANCSPPLAITTLEMKPQTSPLIRAVLSDDIKKIKLEISKGTNLNFKNYFGWTALHYAVVKNSEEMIKPLIKNGADINIGDEKRGQTPLHFAAMTGKKQAVELLLLNNADPYKKDINNKIPKQLAANKEILDLFRKYEH